MHSILWTAPAMVGKQTSKNVFSKVLNIVLTLVSHNKHFGLKKNMNTGP